MKLNSQAHAVMLLTVSLGKSDRPDTKPLSTKEWARFARWLKGHNLEPSVLLKGDVKVLLSGWLDRSITLARLENLLGREMALGLALEKWQRAGLWAITRSDLEYPKRLKKRLRFESPPVFFGCGNKALLDRGGIARCGTRPAGDEGLCGNKTFFGCGGIAVVGSRNADQEDIDFAENLGAAAARQGYSIISGGARGIDESAMLGALKSEGTAVGVMAHGLLRAATSAKYRKYLLADDLVLITPFNPEAGFNVGNAMSRNRYIYCLADAAVVVCSTPNKGGTWHGAVGHLKKAEEWSPRVPLWVKHTASAESGNRALVDEGARWIPHDHPTSLDCLLNGSSASTVEDRRTDPPAHAAEFTFPATTESEKETSEPPDRVGRSSEAQPERTATNEPAAGTKTDQMEMDL